MAIPHLRIGGYMEATSGGTNAAASSSYDGGGGSSNQQRPPVFGSTLETGGGGSSGDYDDKKNPAVPQPDNNQGDDNQDNNQVTETKEEKKSNNFLTDAANLFNEYIGMGGLTGMGAKGIATIFDSVFKPKASTFKNQNNLSIINDLLKNENDLQRYYSQYRDAIEDAGFGTFDQFAADVRESKIPQGSEAQRRLNPEDYYDEDLFVSSGEQDEMLKDYPEFLEKMGLKPMSSRFANTTGNLVDIASIPVTPEMQGNNPEFVKRIFEARMELDRMGRDRSGNPQGQPQGIPSIPGIPSLPLPGPKPPDSYPIFGPRPPFMPGPDPFPLPGPGRPPYGDKFEGPRPYNYFAQSPQYMPQYRFRGVPSLNTDEFNEELRKRFGVA